MSKKMSDKVSCRCCLTRAPDKYLLEKNKWFGETEVYKDMLSECFEITLKIGAMTGDDGICSVCVSRLRDAYSFKKQVLQCQKDFELRLKKVIKDELSPKVKTEISELDDDNSNYIFDIKEEMDIDDDEDDKNLALIAIEQMNLAHKLNKDLSIKKLPKAKKKSECKTRMSKPVGIILKRIKDNSDKNILMSPRKFSFSVETVKHQENIEKILRNSNATPFFDKSLNGYICVYCREVLPNAENLRTHTHTTHSNKTFTNKYRRNNDICVKLDITDLKCNLCEQKFNVISNLKAHLSKEHSMKFHQDVKDYVLEFKLQDSKETLDCALCNSKFETFKMLHQHMNGHYRNFICNTCDMGFINLFKLKNHQRNHEEGCYKCSFCDKIFPTNTKKSYHEKLIHDKSNSIFRKCPHCNETFSNYYQRNRHMVNDHNVSAANYKCNICDRNFLMKSKLTHHIKKVHLMERNHICPECGRGFFMKQYLDEHMIKHKGERIHKCDVCNKAYARKKTLREHMRIHNNDRRFKCGVCNLAFVQKCSLKSHMLSNHGVSLSEYENNDLSV